MPTSLGATFTTQPFNNSTTFTSADGTTAKALVGTAGGPWRVFSILLTNNDTTARAIDIFRRVGSTNSLLGSVLIPPGAGVNGVSPKEFFEALALSNFGALDLTATETLQGSMETAIAATFTVGVTVVGAVY